MLFDHVRQITKAEREYRIHHLVFARRIESDFGTVFSIRTAIRLCIAIRSQRVRILVWGHARAMGRRGIKPTVELADTEAFGCTLDSVRVAARSDWHCH
jgi:hypothetical protein